MLIQFKKGNAKPSVLKCIRSDESSTWTSIQSAIEFHDLAHYVVETELGFSNAFYGLVADGYNMEDFELPREQRPKQLLPANLPVEALQTEHIVNLLQVGQNTTDSEMDFLKTLRDILREKKIAFPDKLDVTSLRSIQLRLKGLLLSWKQLEPGDSLQLSFDLRKK